MRNIIFYYWLLIVPFILFSGAILDSLVLKNRHVKYVSIAVRKPAAKRILPEIKKVFV